METELAIQTILGLDELIVTDVKISKYRIDIYCCSVFEESLCPSCLNKCKTVNQEYIKEIRDLPVFGKKVYLQLTERQFYCPNCNRYFTERFSFADVSRRQTDRFERQIYKSIKISNINQVIALEDITWETANEIFSRQYKKEQATKVNKSVVRFIGMDEFAIKKGHKNFGVVIVDLEQVTIIDVLQNRDKESLIKYFKTKGEEWCNAIEFFCSDMWDGFVNAAKSVFPNAKIITDRFHFFFHINKAVDYQRKALRKLFKDDADFKNIKYLLLKNGNDLTPEEKLKLEPAFAKSNELKSIYESKESLREIFEKKIDKKQAEQELEVWSQKSEKLENKYLNVFLKTLLNWKENVLNYFEIRLTSSVIEGINNKIKMIKRMAFGFLNFDNFKCRIIASFG